MSGGTWFWHPRFWQEKAPGFWLRWSGPPAYESRYCRVARRDAAIERAKTAPRMRPVQTTDIWSDGRRRVTDFSYDTGRKTRVHETRNRAKGSDGLRPRQRRTAAAR